MKSAIIKTTFVSLVGAVLAAGCATTPRPPALLQADKTLAPDAMEAKNAGGAAPGIFNEARSFHSQAVAAYEDGDMDKATHLAELANVCLKTALEKYQIDEAEKRISAARERERKARSIQEDENSRFADLERQVERMEKLMALQKGKAQSEAEKKKLAEQMKAALELEQKTRETQNLISVAAGKLQVANALDSEKLAPKIMAQARSALEAAEKAFAAQKLDAAKAKAEAAAQAATAAADAARAKFEAEKKEMDVLADRKKLFDAAQTVGASSVHQEDRGVVITLHDMFAPGKNNILEHRTQIVDRISEIATKYPDYPIVVEGYTDSRGHETSNLALSTSRAEAVVQRMVSQGKIDFNRIKSAGYGESNPVADNSSREGRAKNRRVQVVLLFR